MPIPLMATDTIAPARKRKGLIVAAVIAMALCILVIPSIAPHNWFTAGLIEHLFGPIIPASGFARNLDSNDNDLVRESLYLLRERGDPVAVPRAIQLLQSPDDYIWLNAALYLGKCGRPEAIPYLIKALRHTASHSYQVEEQYLSEMTGQDFGADFSRWQKWWLAAHLDSKIDWNSHLGPMPRIPSP